MKLLNIFLCASMLLSTSILAQESQSKDPDPVFVFNTICYSKIPNVTAIEDLAAQMAWRALSGDVLEDMKSVDAPEIELAWDASIGERVFRVSVNQAPVQPAMLNSFPDFEGGKATYCSVLVDSIYDPDLILTNMQTLAGKDPLSAGVTEGALETTTWAGGNDDLKVFLFAKVNRGEGGGLLHVTLLQKAE